MGYYTSYDFSNNPKEVIAAIEEISGYGKSDNGEYSSVKWYEYDEHIATISKMFPEEVIVLEGVGEEQGDVWKAYYKNGKSQVCKAVVTFEAFDESKFN